MKNPRLFLYTSISLFLGVLCTNGNTSNPKTQLLASQKLLANSISLRAAISIICWTRDAQSFIKQGFVKIL